MRHPACAAAVALVLAAGGCATTKAPTYTDAQVALGPCPRPALAPRRHVRIPFTVRNHSRGQWPATYLLLSLQGAAKGTLKLDRAPSQGIGGGIRRVTSPLAPGATVTGSVNVYLQSAAPGSVGVGAWGAPANSVAVPNSYPAPSCSLHP